MARATARLLVLGGAAWLAGAASQPALLLSCLEPDQAFSACSGLLFDPPRMALYMDKKCRDADCISDVAIMSAKNPSECLYLQNYRLYGDILNPLRAHCDELARASAVTTPPPTTPSAASPPSSPSSPSSPAQPSPPATTTPRPTDAPATTIDAPAPAPAPTTTTTTTTTPPPPEATTRGESAAPSPTESAVGGSAETDTNGSNATATELPAASTASKSRGRTSSPPPVAPVTVGSERGANASTTQWVLSAVAAVGLLAVVALWASRRRRRKQLEPKSPSQYMAHGSPGGTDQDTHTGSSKTTSASHDSAGTDGVLSGDLHQQIDEILNSDAKLAAWRLHAARLTDKRFLGRGSHAFVHLVELPDRTLVASKRLLASHVSLPAIQQLIHEAHIISALQHHTIVAFLGVAWSSPLDFQLLFEFMAGGDLRAYLDANKPASSALASASGSGMGSGSLGDGVSLSSPRHWTPLQLRMALSIAEGLAYAHSFNPPLVHRDLKSRNVLLTQDLEAKISDFGVSRYLSDDATMTTGVGTNRWLAPEVLAGGGTYTEQCDIYSFGVVLTELDTHEVPFAKETSPDRDGVTSRKRTELSLMQGIARGELRPALSASCPVAVRELATQCLAFDAADRPNALELSHRLRRIVNGR